MKECGSKRFGCCTLLLFYCITSAIVGLVQCSAALHAIPTRLRFCTPSHTTQNLTSSSLLKLSTAINCKISKLKNGIANVTNVAILHFCFSLLRAAPDVTFA